MRVSVSTVFLPCSVSCATEGGRVAFDRTLGMAKGCGQLLIRSASLYTV